MSANDVLDVLNIQRDDLLQPLKKKQKIEQLSQQKSGMARELYNLIGPNTPPVSVNFGGKARDRKQKVSPWTRMPFVPNRRLGRAAGFHHWEKGSKELLEASGSDKEYFFDKFIVDIDIPDMVDEATFDSIMVEIKEQEREARRKEAARNAEKSKEIAKDAEKKKDAASAGAQKALLKSGSSEKSDSVKAETVGDSTGKPRGSSAGSDIAKSSSESESSSEVPVKTAVVLKSSSTIKPQDGKTVDAGVEEKTETKEKPEPSEKSEPTETSDPSKKSADSDKSLESASSTKEAASEPSEPLAETEPEWTYEETTLLFQYCKDFELKWHIINDRFPAHLERSLEDLKEQFYRVSAKILRHKGTGNPSLLDLLDAYSKTAEVDRKQYLESLLKRTPAEIAEEESLVIEARRFELAAKKMLTERSNLLTLLDSPQASQSVQQYSSSQGLTNLYNNLMILDKHQKKKLQQKSAAQAADPVPPPIPQAASSSHKRDRTFQTHLQQYLAGVLKLQPPQAKGEPNPIQQLLAKRLTTKEEEAYGLMYHANERISPNVILRSTQKLPGLQQRQSVFKAVNGILQEMDIPTAGGTVWKPQMPTRKTMAKYDEMVRSVVALLDVKKGKDKLEAEIALIKSQRGLQ